MIAGGRRLCKLIFVRCIFMVTFRRMLMTLIILLRRMSCRRCRSSVNLMRRFKLLLDGLIVRLLTE